jgi:putative colanic acid biosynthesis UDP-glucose lipid carrier transferase
VPDLKLFVNRALHFNYLEDIPILSLRPEPLQDVAGQIKKRLFDIVFSLLVILLLLSWLVPILAILITLDSKGPVFFVQTRSGKNNRPFRCYKFRSLHVNNDADSRQVTKNDNRFTRLGRFLRRTNIDELPQFFNTLFGSMSVVGPRPHMLKHTELYSGLLNEYMVRHFIKPGITGWAQVNGFRGETKTVTHMQKRVEHDIWYMENWSLWLDFKIIILTAFNAIKGEKNAF